MAPTPTVKIDPVKIYELIEGSDIPPRSPQGRGSGKRTAFAIKIGRHPGTIWQLARIPVVSVRLATEIAEGLGVPLSEIAAPDEDEQDEAEQTEGDVAA